MSHSGDIFLKRQFLRRGKNLLLLIFPPKYPEGVYIKSLKNETDFGIPFPVANLLCGGSHMSLERNLDEKGSVSAAWDLIDLVLQEECISIIYASV